ncbi:MAG: hypothetical protein WC565_04340 [Parcubacteria group bacterium]|jgi:hypothetical protein
MKIREFLALFEGRNPESELKGIVLPFAHDLVVVGVANRGEFATLLAEKDEDEASGVTSDDPPDTLPTGCTPEQADDVEPLPAGCKWDDTYVILDDESIKEVTGH